MDFKTSLVAGLLLATVHIAAANPVAQPCDGPSGGHPPGNFDPGHRVMFPINDDRPTSGAAGRIERGTYASQGLTFREMRNKGWRFYKGRWVKWVVGTIHREDPAQDDSARELVEEARDKFLDAMAESADVVPVVNTVKAALENGLSGDARDVWVTYFLVDESGNVLAEHVVHLNQSDAMPFISKRGTTKARKEVLNKKALHLEQRMARGWRP